VIFNNKCPRAAAKNLNQKFRLSVCAIIDEIIDEIIDDHNCYIANENHSY